MSVIYETAARELGTKEIYRGDNSRILEYWRATNAVVKSDEVPWCAAFVNWVLMKCGIEGTLSGLAKSFLHWKSGSPIPLSAARRGDIVVLEREKPHPTFGHVAFFDSYDAPIDTVRLLGGNQSNAVTVAPYPTNRIISIIRPIMPPTPATQPEKYGISATKRGIENVFAVAFQVADGIQPHDIVAVPRVIDLITQVPEIIKESTDYSQAEQAEIGAFVLKQLGLRV
jgi:uncharacterized protein (TIGR02594 family)